jgi:hypothetical protein
MSEIAEGTEGHSSPLSGHAVARFKEIAKVQHLAVSRRFPGKISACRFARRRGHTRVLCFGHVFDQMLNPQP